MQTCYRHRGRETGVACSRCGRPICSECMTSTPVGMRCPECAGERTSVRRGSAIGGFGSSGARAIYALIGVNVIAFVVQLAWGGGAASFDGGGQLYVDGALCGNAVGNGGFCGTTVSEGGEWWRVISSGFLHAGPLHLLLNMFALYILGTVLEPAIGTARMVAIYFVSLLGGALGALLLTDPATFTVGASGAVYGLFGATLLIARHRGSDQLVSVLGFWLLLNLVFTFSVSGISIGGHLGGLAAGAIAGLVVIAAERRISGRQAQASELAVLAGLAVAFVVACVVVAGSGPIT